MKQVHPKAQRSPEETARLRNVRERYQRDKPTPEELLAEGGHQDFIRLGDLLALQELLSALKQERQRQRMTLAKLSQLTGIDQAALSRLESGKNSNPTFETIFRISFALKKMVLYTIENAPPPNKSVGKKRHIHA